MTTAAELHALQETDLALDRALARLADIEAELGETEELLEARRQTEERRQAAEALRSRQTDLEWDVEEVRSKASDVEKKLYGGNVRNPKELEDLQADLTSLQVQVGKREDVLLALLVEIDDAAALLREAEARYAEVDARWRSTQSGLEAERAQIEPAVERLREQRATQSQGMDRAPLNLYELLRERRGGQSVAGVERGMCQGCRITLPVSVLQKARVGGGLVQCVSCERILLVS